MASVRIQTKFLILILGVLVVLLGILSAVIVRREAQLLARKAAEQEHLLARTIVADLKDSMLSGRPRSTLTLIESLQGTYGLVRLAVLRQDGSPAFDVSGMPVQLPQIAEAFRSGQVAEFNEAGAQHTHTNIFPLRNESECRRCHRTDGEVLGVILISHSLEDMLAEIRASKRQLIALFSLIMIGIGVALYAAVRFVVLKPVASLLRGAERIGRGDLTGRISLDSRDEFQDLAETVNDMAGRLRETHTDLEDRVRARTTELNESVRLMRGILASMSSGVALIDGSGAIKLINRQGAWILGHGHEDLLGRRLVEVAPEAAAFLAAPIGAYEEVSLRGPEGMMLPVGFTSSNYAGAGGDRDELIVVFQDLTELKHLQLELVNKERFAAMGRVVAGVAHEIRNPLFGISAIGQIFERDLQDPAQRDLSTALVAETKRLNQLVEELLIYGRPMKLKLESADLRVLWEEVLELHHDELRRRGLRIVGDYAARHPLTFFDPHQLRQVFLNILRNAMEATPDGGTIGITMLLEDSSVLFRVSDTGAGIPQEQLEHVFDLFYTTKPKGTGLGLAICRKIMQDHGGDISIESEAGRGTIVTVRLPVRNSDAGSAPPG